ncbi:MAG: hypothetical protein HOJ35_00775, partial [Bdellovibrionales bacterium]|nr:hypothetical protein [Bdellovibrionales bacterium]
MNVTLQSKQHTQRNVTLYGIAFLLFFIGFLSIGNSSATVVESISGQVLYEDGGDDDWNDLVSNCEGSMTWSDKQNGEISHVTMNCRGTSCGACYQNKWAINMPCTGAVLVERNGTVISSFSNATVGQKVTIADSFCRDMFTDGAICKFNNNFDTGVTADITIICSNNYTSPTDGTAHYFSLAQLFAVDPQADGNWDTDLSEDQFTASVDSSVDKFLRLYLPQTIIPMALASNVFTAPKIADRETTGTVCAERQNFGNCSDIAVNQAVITACNGTDSKACRKAIEHEAGYSKYANGSEMQNYCTNIQARISSGLIKSAQETNCNNGECSDNQDSCSNDNECNAGETCIKSYLAMFPPKGSKKFMSFPIFDATNSSSSYRYATDDNGNIVQQQIISNNTISRRTSCRPSQVANCNEGDIFKRMGNSQNMEHASNTKHGCCPSGWTFEYADDGCFCNKSLGG